MRPTWSAVLAVGLLLTAAVWFAVPIGAGGGSAPAHAAVAVKPAVITNYEVEANSYRLPELPGYPAAVEYRVVNDTTGAAITTLSSIQITGTYYNQAHTLLKLPGTPATVSTAPVGTWHFTIPKNASTTGGTFSPEVTIWANITTPHQSAERSVYVYMGNLAIDNFAVCSTSGACGALISGIPAYVSGTVVVTGSGYTSGAPNETVKLSFYSSGSSPVTVAGVPATLTTGPQGYFRVAFTPLSTVFTVAALDHVQVVVTDSVNATLTDTLNYYWSLSNPAGNVNFDFWLNSVDYYTGSAVTAYWQWAGTNSTVGTVSFTEYDAFNISNGDTLAQGTLSSSAASGSFTFTLPAGFVGTFGVEALCNNATRSFLLGAEGVAIASLFAAVPNPEIYVPGNVITVSIAEAGPALSGTTVNAVVQAENSGATLFSGAVSGGSFQFTIPSVAPAPEYYISAWATNAAGETVAYSHTDVVEGNGTLFWAGVSSKSSYSDGSFSPGSTIQIAYKVTVFGLNASPIALELLIFPGTCNRYVCFLDTPALKIVFTAQTSGSISFTIPSSEANGFQQFNVVAELLGSGGLAWDTVTLNVNSSPSALNYELGAGSGLTVGWLILLVLVIVVGAGLFFLMRRHGRVGGRGGSGSVPEWKEPSSGSSGSGSAPPPPPPPGTQ
jgi:hypothetical protein